MTIPQATAVARGRPRPHHTEPIPAVHAARAVVQPAGIEHTPVLSVIDRTYGYGGRGRHVKRGFDVVSVLVALPLLVPIFVVVAIGIVVSSPGNPLFRQTRVGQGGKSFKCIKFRTMYRDAEERLAAEPELYQRYCCNDFKLPMREDPRIFALGRFLRSSSLDELPQLFNVLVGSMSLVGPRPVVPDELSLYGPWAPAYLAAVPGITGPWQATGRNKIRYPERAQLDAEYMERWSFATDLTIIAKTVPSVLRREGSH